MLCSGIYLQFNFDRFGFFDKLDPLDPVQDNNSPVAPKKRSDSHGRYSKGLKSCKWHPSQFASAAGGCHKRQICFLSQRSSRLGLWEVKVESIHIWNRCNSMILTHRPLRFWFLTMVRLTVMRSPLSVEIGSVKDILTLRKIMLSLATSPRLCQA